MKANCLMLRSSGQLDQTLTHPQARQSNEYGPSMRGLLINLLDRMYLQKYSDAFHAVKPISPDFIWKYLT